MAFNHWIFELSRYEVFPVTCAAHRLTTHIEHLEANGPFSYTSRSSGFDNSSPESTCRRLIPFQSKLLTQLLIALWQSGANSNTNSPNSSITEGELSMTVLAHIINNLCSLQAIPNRQTVPLEDNPFEHPPPRPLFWTRVPRIAIGSISS